MIIDNNGEKTARLSVISNKRRMFGRISKDFKKIEIISATKELSIAAGKSGIMSITKFILLFRRQAHSQHLYQ